MIRGGRSEQEQGSQKRRERLFGGGTRRDGETSFPVALLVEGRGGTTLRPPVASMNS